MCLVFPPNLVKTRKTSYSPRLLIHSLDFEFAIKIKTICTGPDSRRLYKFTRFIKCKLFDPYFIKLHKYTKNKYTNEIKTHRLPVCLLYRGLKKIESMYII